MEFSAYQTNEVKALLEQLVQVYPSRDTDGADEYRTTLFAELNRVGLRQSAASFPKFSPESSQLAFAFDNRYPEELLVACLRALQRRQEMTLLEARWEAVYVLWKAYSSQCGIKSYADATDDERAEFREVFVAPAFGDKLSDAEISYAISPYPLLGEFLEWSAPLSEGGEEYPHLYRAPSVDDRNRFGHALFCKIGKIDEKQFCRNVSEVVFKTERFSLP